MPEARTNISVTQNVSLSLKLIKAQISATRGRMITMSDVLQILVWHWESDQDDSKIKNALQKFFCAPEVPKVPELPEIPEVTQNWVALTGEKGGVALVDRADWALVARQNWHPVQRERTGGRVVTYAQNGRGLYMHTLITGWALVDHINGDGLDNRRVNLREATQKQNMANQRKAETYGGRPTSSRYKGVTWDKRAGKWLAQIVVKGHCKGLGRYLDETEAARAYDIAAREAWGEYSRLNFP